ncbi:iron-sulfur cluster assembly protein, partial [Halovivax sp.]|uniref:iron-sulfur cluster assembly protein n=1 Tax=Halovivax sp. TaxID=1935978 RepID=UPI0025C58E20
MASEKRLLNRLRSVDDPALGVDVVTLGLVTDVRVEDGAAAVTLAFDAPLSPAEWTMCDEVRACCRGLGLDPRIYADADRDRALAPGVKNAVGICADDREAGAGLVTANLAAALASIGARVGIFDLRFDGGERTVDGGERT